MSDPAKRPRSRDGRTKSATARLKTPPSEFSKQKNVVTSKTESSKSAVLNRDKHVSSKKVFPRPASADKERFKSQYSRDFEGSYVVPTSARPTSPTRRNNPHPTKQFMVWRVPSREIGAMGAVPEFPDLGEEFNLEGSFEKMKLPPARPTSKDYGAYLDRLPSRQSQRGEYYFDDDYLNDPLPKRQSISHEVLDRTLQSGNQAALADWLKNASPEEQQTVFKMLRKAEESQIKQTVSNVMQPAAAKAVNNWISSADERERDVAVRLFSSLGSRQGHRKRSASVPNIQHPMMPQLPRVTTPSQGTRQPPPGAERGGGAPWPASLWHYKPVRDPPPQIYHRGSLFGAAKGGASHYTIHPEWPDYQQATFTTDIVQ